MNYRLGPFGFCAHENLKDASGALANFGLYDQQTAIEWVMHNIAAFGGNVDNITLMGQSAGAMSVDIHLNNPRLNGCFKRAIMLSGAGLQRALLKPLSIQKITPFWDKVMHYADASSIAELRAIQPKKLYYAWKKACAESPLSMPYTFPVYDGKILRKGSFTLQTVPDMPYLIGATCTDMIPMVLERIDKKWGKAVEKSNRKPCYFYNFNHNLPGDDMGAWHSAELLYVFSTLDKNWRPFEAVDYRLSQQLSDAVAAFAESGDPNTRSLPVWKAGYREPMSLSEQCGNEKWRTMENIRVTLTGKGKTI